MPQPDSSLRLLSFNIRYDNPHDGRSSWAYRAAGVADLFRQLAPDVAGLQEALANQVNDLAQRLPDYGWLGVGRDDGATQGEFAAIFYRRDCCEPLASGSFWLSATPEVPGSRSWDSACIRIATWGRFRERHTGREFYFLNTHFDHAGKHARDHSAMLLLERLTALRGTCPAIVTGDLNCTPTSQPYRILVGSGLRDARIASHTPHRGPRATFHAFTGVPLETIDYLFVTPGVTVLSHTVFPDRPDPGLWSSDHFPLLAEVVLPDAD